MKNSLKIRIVNFLEAYERMYPQNPWVHKGLIEEKAKEIGYLGDNASRRLRELFQEGRIDRQLVNGSVTYRYRL